LYLDPDEIIDKFINLVDVIVCTDEYSFTGESTVIDMVSDNFKLIRKGADFDIVSQFIDFEE
jgi:tRNA A37 threonylcarbamoyladenosine synthetase subunit TsaC/SUA5/YrdC